MTTEQLHAEMVAGFRRVDTELSTLREEVGTLRREVGTLDGKVGTLDGKVGTLDGKVGTLDGKVGTLHGEVATLREEMGMLRAEVKSEAETTRRHFDVMVERVEAHVRIVAEVNSHHRTILNDHEQRLQAIEKRP